MAKVDKKIIRLQEQIASQEAALINALGKKSHNVAEVNVPALTARIRTMKSDLAALLK